MKKIERIKFQVTTLSPIHVGTGKEFSRWDYFINNDKLNCLNYDLFAENFSESFSLLNEFVDDIVLNLKNVIQNQNKTNLNSYIKDSKFKEDLQNAINTDCTRNLSKLFDKDRIRSVKLSAGYPYNYIPGSSIKGAIRTGYLNRVLDNTFFKPESFNKTINGTFNANSTIGSKICKKFQKLAVSDSHVISKSQYLVAPMSIYSDGSKQDSAIEVLNSQSIFSIDISFIDELINDWRKILENVNKFYKAVWDAEKANRMAQYNDQKNKEKQKKMNLHEFYCTTQIPEDSYLLRIGYGSSQLATSLMLKYKNINNNDDSHFKRLYSVYSDDEAKMNRKIYPYSSKSVYITDFNNPEPLGWVVLKPISKYIYE